MAREECKILIRYSQVLQTEHGQVRLMLPTTIAPRFGNPITQGKMQPHQVPVTDLTAEYPFDITLMLMGDMAYCNVSSPSHKTSYTRNKEDLIVKLSQRGYLDRDFVIVMSNLKNLSDGLACLDTYVGGQSAMMAFFSPRIDSAGSKAFCAKVLVDCSASMAGDSIDAARRALQAVVNGLSPEDKFSLSRFGDTVEHRSRGLWNGTGPAKASAKRWIDNVSADLGGTEMAAALVSTIAIPNVGSSDILLITDGEIEGIDEVIEVARKSSHRVFIVAIGASPSEVHLRRLALATGGHCDFVAPGEVVEPAVIRMSARMRAARATNLRVEWPKALNIRWAQSLQNHAFEDDVLNACAFADAPADVRDFTVVKLWGRVEGVAKEALLAEASLTLTESSTNITARLTGYEQYQELRTKRAGVDTGVTPSSEQDLAVSYRLVTDDTNFILVHERSKEEQAQEMPDVHKVPQMLAAGWAATGSVVRSSQRPFANAPVGWEDDVDNIPFVSTSVSCYMPLDSKQVSKPSVWRTNRAHSSARIDALSSGGMDDYEIPAFLRKQADAETTSSRGIVRQGIDKLNPLLWMSHASDSGRYGELHADFGFTGITPLGVAQWLKLNDETLWPSTFAELRDLGLALAICEWLEFGLGSDSTESEVVSEFLAVVVEMARAGGWGVNTRTKSVGRVLMGGKPGPVAKSLVDALLDDLKMMTPQYWPNAVVHFPQNSFG